MMETLKQVITRDLVGAFVALGFGWLLAVVLSRMVRRIASGMKVTPAFIEWILIPDAPPGPAAPPPVPSLPNRVAAGAAKATFSVVMFFAIVTFFHLLAKTSVLEPLSLVLNPLVGYIPKIVNAVVVLIVTLIVATVVKRVAAGVLRLARIDQRLRETLGDDSGPDAPVSSLVASIVFWLVIVFFLPAILAPFGLPDLLEPLANITDRIFGFAPNIVAAMVILLVGYFAARIVQRLLAAALDKLGINRVSEPWCKSAGLRDLKISQLLAQTFALLLLVAVWIAALEALHLEAIYAPAAEVFNKVTGMLPNLLGAALVLAAAILLGRVLAALATNLLTGLGLNALWVNVGFAKEMPEPGKGPAKQAGQLLFLAIVGLALAEAASLLGFEAVPVIFSSLVVSSGHIVFGVAIFAAGILIARWAGKVVRESQLPRAAAFAMASRVAILVVAAAVALHQMHLANEIITLGFALALGAVGIAVAVAFGLAEERLPTSSAMSGRKSGPTRDNDKMGTLPFFSSAIV